MKKLSEHLRKLLLDKSYSESCVVIYGNNHVFLENIKRVYELDEFCVSAGTRSGDITIYGTELKVKNCKTNSLNIYGRISSCEIKRRNIT